MKVKMSSIMAVLLYHIIFIKLTYISCYSTLINLFMVLIALYLMSRLNKIDKKYKTTNICLLVYLASIVFSSLYNGNNVLKGIIFAVKIAEVFFIFEYFRGGAEEKHIIKIFYVLTLTYCCINDLFLIFVPGLYNKFGEYLVGNKFSVSYLHITLVILYILNVKAYSKSIVKRILKVIIFLTIVVYVSVKTECSTAIVGIALISIMYVVPKYIKEKLYKPKVLIATILICCSILLIFSNILQNKYIAHFIVDVLHEDLTLTGRTNIYAQIGEVIQHKWILGYGYGNSHEVISSMINYPNAQNGLLECIVNYGVLGTTLLMILIFNVVKNLSKYKNREVYYPVLANIYMYSIIASVEITIGIMMISLLSICNVGGNVEVDKEGTVL